MSGCRMRHGPHTAYRIPHTAYAIPISINADPQSAFCFRITSDFAFCSLVLHSSISDLRCSMAWPFALRHVCGPSLERLGDQPGQQLPTGEILAHFQANNARSAPFFLCVRWHVTCKRHFRSIFFAPPNLWSCSATASGSRGAKVGERWHGFRLSLPSFSRRVLSSN
jgi:hypothetical protein